ncbi:MAG: Acetyltransferase, GNAT family [uncultured Cytophagales bacterium]|uniref:Acetyltransferase, GNAT family n=1 Tax=uncultured Cytophagales bacterium TaxID=158755 RepID=A0A6J4LXD3_9SPHI|nr:MAG: Acetyltransferase, GNAT family [uncultured Cytophagales bacterium]
MSFTITQAHVSHLDGLVPLFDAYRVFYGQPSEPGRCRSFLAERLANRESVVYLAADGETHEPLGFVQLYPLFSSVSVQRLWIVNDLFVQPGARKRGVAAGLLERCRNLARETGAKGLQLETATDNHAAQRLYEQTGFTRIDAAFYFLKT